MNDIEKTVREIIFHELTRMKTDEDVTEDLAYLKIENDLLADVFLLNAPSIVQMKLGGRITTSIHRKVGDACEKATRAIIGIVYSIKPERLVAERMVTIDLGDGRTEQVTRKIDVLLKAENLDAIKKQKLLAIIPQFSTEFLSNVGVRETYRGYDLSKAYFTGVGIEVRHAYQSADSKRVQGDKSLAELFIKERLLPVMLIYSGLVNWSVINAYKRYWLVKVGNNAFDFIKDTTGIDFGGILRSLKPDVHHFIKGRLSEFRISNI